MSFASVYYFYGSSNVAQPFPEVGMVGFSNFFYELPDGSWVQNVVGGVLYFAAQGGTGGFGAVSGVVSGNIYTTYCPATYDGATVSGYPLNIWPGDIAPETGTGLAGNGADGFSGGGAGCTDGNGGGASSGIVCTVPGSYGLIIAEAAGSNGGYPLSGPANPAELGGGGGGGYSGSPGTGQTVPPGVVVGGGGGSQGGPGGGSNLPYGVGAGRAGVGAGGALAQPGGSGSSGTAGVGGSGSGVYVNAQTGTSYADASVNEPNYSQATSLGSGLVIMAWYYADAPDGPTILSPTAGQEVDLVSAGVTLVCQYNGSSLGGITNCGPLQAIAVSVDTYYFFNGVGFGITPVWLIPTTGGGALNGGEFTIDIPPGVLMNGVTYDFVVYAQESYVGIVGPASASVSITGAAAPVASWDPTMSTTPNTLTPTLDWFVSGGYPYGYEIAIYTQPTLSPEGLNYTNLLSYVGTSGLVLGTSATSWTYSGSPLYSGVPYYAYLMVYSTGSNPAASWVEFAFVPELISGSAPSLSAALSVDPLNGMPSPSLTLNYSLPGETVYGEFQGAYDDSLEFADINVGVIAVGTTTQCQAYDSTAPFNVDLSYRGRTVFVSGGQYYYSPWSSALPIAPVISMNWWIVPADGTSSTPFAQAMMLTRLPSSGSSSSSSVATPTTPAVPSGLSTSIMIDAWEQQGVFRTFGQTTAIIVHGDIWDDEFDLDMYFQTSEAFQQFKSIRTLLRPVLLKSDMEGATYWVTLGSDLTGGIVSRTGRQQNPTRGLTVHCTPTATPYIG